MKNIKSFEKYFSQYESYISNVTSSFVDKDWDTLYDEAQQPPLKGKIREMLVKIFRDKDVKIRVGDNFEWSDGSNGVISFSNFNHYITDIGYKTYADNPKLIDDLEGFKNHILFAYASSDGNLKKGQKYAKFNYVPTDEFKW